MALGSPSLLPLLFFAIVSGLAVAVLVLFWVLAFKSSFLPRSSTQEHLIFAALHPLLMVIGFILISGEAILVNRWLPGSRNFKKSVHLCLQGLALACGAFGIWTKFHGEDGFVGNFYSLHSWMGLICIFLFGAQWLVGFLSFWQGGTHSEAEAVALARFPGALYLWSGGGHSRNWAAGEVDIFADQEKRTQTLSRVNGGE